jgi:ribosomal protein S1
MSQNKKYAGNPTDKNKSSNPLSATPYKRKYGLAKLIEETDPFFFNPGEIEEATAQHERLAQLLDGTTVLQHAFRKEFIEGTVISKSADGYYVNIGRKYDAVVPLSEAAGLSVGDTAEFYVTEDSNKEGIATLSFTAAKGWRYLESIQGTGTILSARVFSEAMKRRTQKSSGVRVEFIDGNLKGIRGFVPNGELGRNNWSKDLVGQIIDVTVITAEPQKGSEFGNLVLSNKEAQASADAFAFSAMSEGEIVSGKIIHFLKAAAKDSRHSALIKLDNGLVGMLHHSETADREDNIDTLYKVGDDITVAVRSLDDDKKRIGLSLKLAAQINCLNTLAPNTVVEAKILRKVTYGYFASIHHGAMEGLIHESDLQTENGRPESFATGDITKVVVINFNPDGSRLALGRKQLA